MTCIAAAFKSPTEYALAADSCREWRGSRILVEKPKLFGGYIFATAGSGATGGALADALMAGGPPDDGPGVDAWLRAAFAKVSAGAQPQPGFTMPAIDAEFLMVGRTGIYLLTGDGAVLHPRRWWAIGSGGAEARGVMWATFNERHTQDVVRLAVEAAIEMDVGCFGPVVVKVG